MVALALNLLAALMMTGVVLHEQIVHYPLFDEVGKKQFKLFMREHVLKTSYFVGPVLIFESIVALWLAIMTPSIQATLALLLLVGVWIVTFMLLIPDYRDLAMEKDKKAIRKLLRNNLLRVGLWAARSLLLLSLLWHTTTITHW